MRDSARTAALLLVAGAIGIVGAAGAARLLEVWLA